MLYLLYLAIILLLGIIITGVTISLKISNILFLVLAGYFIKLSGTAFFNEEIMLILSSLTLIIIVLETTMKLDINHIKKKFMQVLKFNIFHFIVCAYIMTLAIFLFFDLPGKEFEQFILCFILSIIIYGVDSLISMEFSKEKEKDIHEIMEIEGFISGPLVVVFAFFVINYLSSSVNIIMSNLWVPILEIFKEIAITIIIGASLAYILHKFKKNFEIPTELWALSIITTGIIVFVSCELLDANGSLAVAIFGLLLRGFTKSNLPKKYTATLAHLLYIIVFILFGSQIILPSYEIWLKGIGLFIIYLVIRFISIVLFLKDLNWREKIYMSLNVAKGIEVALVLFIMFQQFKNINGIEEVVSIGFMFFILSYITSTTVNFFSKKILKS